MTHKRTPRRAAAFFATMAALTLAAAGCQEAPPESRFVETEDGAAKANDAISPTNAAPTTTPEAPDMRSAMEGLKKAPVDIPVVAAGGLEWRFPPEWTAVEPETSSRVAQLVAPAPPGVDAPYADVIVFYFGGAGGNVDQNIVRWANLVLNEEGRPTEPVIDRMEPNDLRITHAELTGTFMSGTPGTELTPYTDHTLIGVVIEGGPDGNVYARIVGPTPVVAHHRELFLAMLRSTTPGP